MPSAIVAVDGTVFTGQFHGFGHRLGIDTGDSDVWLDPWLYRDHMAALKDCAFASGGGLELDRQRFADRIMDRGQVPAHRRDAVAPLALWWAAGGEPIAAGVAGTDDTIDLGSTRARLRPWTERERLAALLAARVDDESGQTWLDATGYLDAMTRASAAGLGTALDTLDSWATAILLDAVVALNIPDPANDPVLGSGPAARAMAERTLRRYAARLAGHPRRFGRPRRRISTDSSICSR